MMKHLLLTSCALLGLSGTAQAMESLHSSPYDRTIKTVIYNSRNRTPIYGTPNHSIDIVLQRGEFTEGHVIDHPNQWQYKPLGRDVFIRPNVGDGQKVEDSSMTILTNRRRYQFKLHFIPNQHSILATQEVDFVYPKSHEKEVAKSARDQTFKAYGSCSEQGGAFNDDYWMAKGYPRLGLVHAWDNGQFTCLEFAPNVPMPEALEWGPGTSVSIVDTTVEGRAYNIMVIPEVRHRFLLLYNKRVTGIWNQDFKNERFANTSNTNSPLVREVIKPAAARATGP